MQFLSIVMNAVAISVIKSVGNWKHDLFDSNCVFNCSDFTIKYPQR